MSGGERPVGDDDIEAYVDDRLAPDRRESVRAFIAARPELEGRIAEDLRLRAELRSALRAKADGPVPTRLRVAAIRAERRLGRRRRLAFAAAASMLLVLGGLGGWTARGALGSGPARGPAGWAAMAQDALSAHRTFAVEVVHPVEVKAEQEAHLAQWLSKRLGRTLVIPDLDAHGLTLVGGRLLPAGRDVAAQIMYTDARGARLTLYVRCGETGERALRFMQEGEVSSFSWADEGTGYAVSAAMDRERLQGVARAVLADVDLEAARKRRAL